MKKIAKMASIGALGMLWAGAHAITFTGINGNLAAQADFDIVGGNLQVTLTNISNNDVLVPTDVLTGVFFNVAGDPAFTRLSAVLAPGSSVLFGGSDPGGVVGGEWAYKNGLNQYGANSGISSSGLGIYGPGDVFPGSNLQGPGDPDGLQYGLTSAGDNPSTGNTPVTGSYALIKNSVVFNLGGLPTSFDINSIDNVTFQYGTALDEGHIRTTTSVPGPMAVVPFIGGLLVALRRKRI